MMKIVLEQVGQHLEMSVEYTDRGIDSAVTDMAEELDHRQGVKRKSWNCWHWDLRRQQEAEDYVTYFCLKHDY